MLGGAFMYLSIYPHLEVIREFVRQRDFLIALSFFMLEAVVLVWLLPKFLDNRAEQREEHRRLPSRQIAAERISDSIHDLLREGDSLYRALCVADSNAGMEDSLDKAEQKVGDVIEFCETTIESLERLSGEEPRPGVPAKQPDLEKAAKAKNQRRLNLNKNLFIERNVDSLIQSIEDTQRAIDAFLPVFSVEMIECAAKLYERLAQTEKPYRALKRALHNPNDEVSVMEATYASINAGELLSALKQLCDRLEIDTSKLANKFLSFADEQEQKAKMQDFLYLHFEGSYKQLLIDSGLL
jgi:hypothetical protein